MCNAVCIHFKRYVARWASVLAPLPNYRWPMLSRSLSCLCFVEPRRRDGVIGDWLLSAGGYQLRSIIIFRLSFPYIIFHIYIFSLIFIVVQSIWRTSGVNEVEKMVKRSQPSVYLLFKWYKYVIAVEMILLLSYCIRAIISILFVASSISNNNRFLLRDALLVIVVFTVCTIWSIHHPLSKVMNPIHI